MAAKQPRRRRLWLNDGSCVRLRPTFPDHVWSYDFVFTPGGPSPSSKVRLASVPMRILGQRLQAAEALAGPPSLATTVATIFVLRIGPVACPQTLHGSPERNLFAFQSDRQNPTPLVTVSALGGVALGRAWQISGRDRLGNSL